MCTTLQYPKKLLFYQYSNFSIFLSDGVSGNSCIPLVTPSTLILSSRGRVRLYQNQNVLGSGPSSHLLGYLAPEFKTNKIYTDTEMEKVSFDLIITLRRVYIFIKKTRNLRITEKLLIIYL